MIRPALALLRGRLEMMRDQIITGMLTVGIEWGTLPHLAGIEAALRSLAEKLSVEDPEDA